MRFSRLSWIFAAFLFAAARAYAAGEGPIKPFKDELFSRHAVIETDDGGAFRIVDYNELRDINGRDRVVEKRVKDAYVSLGIRRQQANETLRLAATTLELTRVGPQTGAAFSVIFIHGRGGDRRLGANDHTFGGNFNRLKNLAAGNGGTYYAPSVPSFDAAGSAAIAGLIRHAHEQSAGRPVILACASMGGFICRDIARDRAAAGLLSGMVLLGAPADAGLAATPFAARKLPVYFAHGSSDRVYRADDQRAVYAQLRKNAVPARFTLFATGGHGTPIRMVDWRAVLNFMLARV